MGFNKEEFLKGYKNVLCKEIIEMVKTRKKKKKVPKSRYLEPNGRFKEMTCPDNPKKKSRYCGCLRYFMAQGYTLEQAKKLCGYIKYYVKKGAVSKFKDVCKGLDENLTLETISKVFDELCESVPSSLEGYELDDLERLSVTGFLIYRELIKE